MKPCDPGSNPGADVIHGLSLLLVFVPAPRGFSLGFPVFLPPQKPAFPNSNSILNQWILFSIASAKKLGEEGEQTG